MIKKIDKAINILLKVAGVWNLIICLSIILGYVELNRLNPAIFVAFMSMICLTGKFNTFKE